MTLRGLSESSSLSAKKFRYAMDNEIQMIFTCNDDNSLLFSDERILLRRDLKSDDNFDTLRRTPDPF